MLIFLFAIKFCVSYNIFQMKKQSSEELILKFDFFKKIFVLSILWTNFHEKKIIEFTFLFSISLEFTSISYFLKKIFYCEEYMKY
jgi:hypothetical protein